MKTKVISKQSGMSLIEILVSVVVVSVGLLGVARMEIVSKQSNYEALQRTNASYYASDMMEKMRANPTNLALYVNQTVGDGTLAVPAVDCNATACTNSEIAEHDLWDWEQILIGTNETSGGTNTGGLVSPRACVTGPATGEGGEYIISVAWRGQMPLTNPTTSTCGEGLNLYGANDEYRRVVTVTVFISDASLI